MTNFFPIARALTISISPNLPGLTNASTVGPAGWIVGFYKFALIFAGILAFGSVVYGGFKYATSEGNSSKQAEGRSWIWSALIGLLLLAGAYLILYTINPSLTHLQNPGLTTINIQPQTTSTTGGALTCGGTVNAPCPNPSQQTCQNQGGALQPSYTCVANSTFDCGQPKTHYGSCPGTETCVNGAGPNSAQPSYYCST